MHRIAVGLITLFRPQMLEAALQSLVGMTMPEGCELRLILVDNDDQGSAEKVFDKFVKLLPLECTYFREGRRGIPFARNRVIEEALKLECSEIAFFDDDEVVAKDWLLKLFEFYLSQGCDIAAGPVIPVLPPDAPSWILQGRFFDRAVRKEGAVIESAATNNVLYSSRIFSELNLRYNEDLAFLGGEDTFLSRQAVQAGCVIKWTNDALVYETVPASRLSLVWMSKRNFRIGAGLSSQMILLSGKKKAFPENITWSLGTFLHGLRVALGGILRFDRTAAIKGFFIILRALGRACGMCGLYFNEYKVIHGE